jgi:hypothetical protein
MRSIWASCQLCQAWLIWATYRRRVFFRAAFMDGDDGGEPKLGDAAGLAWKAIEVLRLGEWLPGVPCLFR